MEIVEEAKNIVTPNVMEFGSIGVIEKWGTHETYVGRIVTKVEMEMGTAVLITIGEKDSNWSNCNDFINLIEYQIRILPKGTLLKI